MSYNGTGTFNINTAGQPVVAGTTITATAFNALTTDLASGLSTAICKDGQSTPTANIPMGGYRITNLGAGTAATDAARLSQVQAGSASYVTVSGTDTLTGTLTPTLTAYAAGNAFTFLVANTNTGAVTLNIDGLGAKAITRDGSTALSASDLLAGEMVLVVYDGTRFQILNGAGTFTNLSISGTLAVGGVATFTSQPILSSLTASSAVATDASKGLVSVTNTGSGNNVLATSPVLVTPNLGTPSAAVLTNATGLPMTTGVTGTLALANGGTGATTAADARTNLGITATGSDTTYAFRANNLSDLASASTARTNLGLGSIATQAASAVSISGGSITGITDLAVTDGGTGASTAADARTNLGLGTIATQSAGAVDIDGGAIDGTPIGGSSASTGAFTTLTASGTAVSLVTRSVQVFTSSGTWTKPTGLQYAKVTVVGGGGGGGGPVAVSAGNAAGGAGGGGGGTSIELIATASLGATESVTVGAGGTAGSSGNGGTGGTSSFGSHSSATGGVGGAQSANLLENSALGGAGGTGSGGDVNIKGQSGSGCLARGGSWTMAGTGGSSTAGGGGQAGSAPGAGATGGSYGGGGGGGAGVTSGAAQAGGAGAAGIVIVEEFY